MIEFTAAGIRFRMHVLVLITGALAICLGMKAEMGWVMAALFVHETGHIIAARICNVEIEYIEIMPFGGVAHIRGLYSQRGIPLALTALAGPAANGAFVVVIAAMGWWGALKPDTARSIMTINAMLMAFNMLPALPLDGGRIMYAIVRRFMGKRRAVDIGAGIAYLMAAALAAAALWLWFAGGKFNISLVIMAVFLTASAWDERKSALEEGISGALHVFCSDRPLPALMRVVALDAGSPMSTAAKYMGGREMTLFAVIRGGRVAEFISEGEAAGRILEEG